MKTFAQVLDSADKLSLDEQQLLVEVLQRRVSERRRAVLIETVASARDEFVHCRCRPGTAKQTVKRILG